MCGIVSIFNYKNVLAVSREELRRIRDHMALRGPDGAGEWYAANNRAGLGHRRLAILDLSEAGAQPMGNEDGTVCITFNGEIYNYQPLRASLQELGHRFKSGSDTEVLIHGYEQWGIEGLLPRLRGMFAFVIYDGRQTAHPRLVAARDPFGIKPLYYADDGKTFRAASQVKALLAGGCVDTTPAPAGHVGFFLWGCVPEPYTMYKGIRALPAGSYIAADGSGAGSPHVYCHVPSLIAEAGKKPVSFTGQETMARLREAALDSVKHHLVADVPVGVFLSAGLDSGTLAGLASEVVPGRLHTVTLAFREYLNTLADESTMATLVADHYRTAHETVWVEKKDFEAETEALFQAMDQPTTDGVNSYFVAKAAAKAGLKVVLSGVGGDELFGTYPSFRQVPRMARLLGPFAAMPLLGRGFRAVSAPFFRRFTSPKYAGLFEYGGSCAGAYLLRRSLFMPWELPRLLDGEIVRQGWNELQTMARLDDAAGGIKSDYLKVSALELQWYMRNQLLRDTDWAGMAHSLEVRTPLVDLEFLRAVAPMLASANRPAKRDFSLTPEKPLPQPVLNRGKTGFAVPVRQWLAHNESGRAGERGLRDWARHVYGNMGWTDYLKSNAKCHRNISSAHSPHDGKHEGSLLVYRIGQLGDTLVSMPALQAIRRKFPNHRFVLLTDRHPGKGYVTTWDVLKPAGWFDDAIFYVPGRNAWSNAKNGFALVRKLRKISPEYVFNLSPDRNMMQTYRDTFFFKHLAAAPYYRSAPAPNGAHDGNAEPEWKRLMRIIEEHPSASGFRLTIPKEAEDEFQRVSVVRGLPQDMEFMAVGPGSKMPAKRWAAERFGEVGRLLLAEFPRLFLLVLGGKEDEELGNGLCRAWGERSANLAGALSIYGSAAALEKCAAYIGNDTGTMHLAAMAGVPCVALFSARDHAGKWDPYGDSHIILRHGIECAWCMLEECMNNNRCMDLITVSEVFEAVKKALAGAGAHA
ncbi:MAG: asparagine synthase (glutamine-hydrolyzing) [Actinomycetota bacterium]|nr:asparagine synthase (glutamine-hydrolyzing) [Actinomycetota bacterium]